MKKTIKLTESDLSNLVKRVVSEQQSSTGTTQGMPPLCDFNTLKKIKEDIKNENTVPLTIQTSAAFGKPNIKKYLFITYPNNKVCGCKKSDFFNL